MTAVLIIVALVLLVLGLVHKEDADDELRRKDLELYAKWLDRKNGRLSK